MDIQKVKKSKIILNAGIFILFFIFLILILFKSNRETESSFLSLTFDDGYLTHYTLAYPELKERNLSATFYILANYEGLFESKELMSLKQAKEIQDNGLEIGSHTLNHPDILTLNSQELNQQLAESRQILENAGINISSFAYPFGRFNDSIAEETGKYYSSARTTIKGYNNLENLDFYKLKSLVVTGEMSPKKICNRIKGNKYWLILTFHNINSGNSPSNVKWDISLEKFKAILECIKNEKINVKTVGEVISSYEKRN